MRIEINDKQSRYKVHRPRLEALLRFLLDKTRRLDPATGWQEISLVLTDDRGIRRVNMQVFQRPDVTDVISCRYEPMPGQGDLCRADVFINLQRAARAAPDVARRQPSPSSTGRAGRSWSVDREVALYAAHGCDHLTGANDATAVDRRRMRRRELRWLHEAEACGLVTGLLAGKPSHEDGH